MRPVLKLLEDSLIERIVAETRDVLCRLGVEIHNAPVLSMLADHGADVDIAGRYVCLTEKIIDKALVS